MGQRPNAVKGAERGISMIGLLTAGRAGLGAVAPAAAAGRLAIPAAIVVAGQGLGPLPAGLNGIGDAV